MQGWVFAMVEWCNEWCFSLCHFIVDTVEVANFSSTIHSSLNRENVHFCQWMLLVLAWNTVTFYAFSQYKIFFILFYSVRGSFWFFNWVSFFLCVCSCGIFYSCSHLLNAFPFACSRAISLGCDRCRPQHHLLSITPSHLFPRCALIEFAMARYHRHTAPPLFWMRPNNSLFLLYILYISSCRSEV